MNFGRVFILTGLAGVRPAAGVQWGNSVEEHITSCENDSNPNKVDFTVRLEFDDGKRYPAKCEYSYSRCPLDGGKCLPCAAYQNGQSNCPNLDVDEVNDWTSQAPEGGVGGTFGYLETRTYYVSDDSTPKDLFINDDKGTHACARALFQEQYQDFYLGSPSQLRSSPYSQYKKKKDTRLDITEWWGQGVDPVHLTIIPFNADNNDCQNDEKTNVDFDEFRALAIWITPHEGQTEDPKDPNIVYCDLSKNPEDCLNLPYWDIDSSTGTDELVLYGPLTNVLSTAPQEVSIFIPEGYDVSLPISDMQMRYEIANGNSQGCKSLIDGNTSAECHVVNGKAVGSFTDSKITVSGLGRVSGWESMVSQIDNGFRPDKYSKESLESMGSNGDFDFTNLYKEVGEWYMMAYLVSLSSLSSGTGADGFAIDVSGIEVAWGSRIGQSTVGLNSIWHSGDSPSNNLKDYPVKVYDIKQVGNWNDQADGMDLMGDGSRSDYTYHHVNDDGLKVIARNTKRMHTTLLKGNSGAGINISGYGNTKSVQVSGSWVQGVYFHRIVHRNDSWGGGGYGGLVATYSCGENDGGIVDVTVTDVHVPELGDINTVAQPFNIGVGSVDDYPYSLGFCNGGATGGANSYPIKNLVFKNFFINPDPFAKSRFYDEQGVVQWGDGSTPSVTFYDPDSPNTDPSQDVCKFDGAVEFKSSNQDPTSDNPAYFPCGFEDQQYANAYCMDLSGNNGYCQPNIHYTGDGVNDKVNIKYPTCGYYPSSEAVAIA